MSQYNYDEEGHFFPFVVLTFLIIILIPITFSFLYVEYKKDKEYCCLCDFCKEKNKILHEYRKRTILKPKISKKAIFISVGWCLVGYVIYQISSIKVEHKIWDPYEILGISMSATEKEIRKQYKKLSLKLHPDKVLLNETQTRESVESLYIEVTKAYKALTDDDVRRNYIEYGHPDGKQDFSIGIALPKWIVESKNNYYVLSAYAIAFGFALPYFVGKWWYGNKLYTREGIHAKSAERFFKGVEEIMVPGKAELLISQSQEYKFLTGFEDELKTIEQKILQKDNKYLLHKQQDLSYRKTYLLLYAHFHRIGLQSFKLRKEQISLLESILALHAGLLSISLIYGFLQPIIYIMELSQSIVQGIPSSGSPLLQLPYISKKIAKGILEKIGYPITLQQFIKIPEEKRRSLLSSYTDKEYSLIMDVASKIPILNIVDSSFKVTESDFISPDSIVQFSFKARCIFLGEDVEAIESEFENKTSDENELNTLLGYRKKKNAEDSVVPYAHVPFYPKKHKPKWWVFLVDIKHDRIVVPPISITDIGKSIRTFQISFQAPSQIGLYTFQIQVKSDTYIGTDFRKNVEFKVDENITPKNSTIINNVSQKKKLKSLHKDTKKNHALQEEVTKKNASDSSYESSFDEYDTDNSYHNSTSDSSSDSDTIN
ncbi:hypothetical protein PNEG_02269 [Pneumocystis murina B123]|uniref:J domain-containing protein n=1 Tax=Pneumocystis murina (strain B123) TaxID=1069680 RepID=M7P639_PNEMU|nr:hypothetical protein PNEG_02269 [Pneumocystis murina B123]EMR09310.1 hypothetical protein PNEG_02269 [Pneumocystis murina B123]